MRELRVLCWILLTALLITSCEDLLDTAAPTSPSDPAGPTSVAVSGPGCYHSAYSGYGYSDIGCGVLTTSGNRMFDQAFRQEIALQGTFFTSPAAVYLFNECDIRRANALSFPQGFILFGIHMANKLIMAAGGDDLPVAAILAHEYAHQLQFRYGWINRDAPTRRDSELEADAFAGYYGGLRKSWTGSRLQTYYEAIFNLGDFNFNDPRHHGTHNQRLGAALIGYETATAVGHGMTWQQLHEVFSYRIATEVIPRAFATNLTDLSAAAQAAVAKGNSHLVKAVVAGERDLRGLQ